MTIVLTANLNNPPISGLATAHLINETVPVDIVWSKQETSLLFPDKECLVCHSNNDVLRALARAAPEYKLYGETAIERTQIDHWLSFSLTCEEDISWALTFLDKSIAPITYLVANKLTIADFALFNEMHSRYKFLKEKGIPQHVQRWYDLIHSQPLIQKVLEALPNEARESMSSVHLRYANDEDVAVDNTVKGDKSVKTEKNTQKEESSGKTNERKQEGKFVDLPGAEMGKVVVRFPPEASGYLHIGHAKAALLNQYYAQAFNGTLIMRFDDTNPAKETVEFENVILGDLELLEIKPDLFTHTSNYFDLMLDYCVQLIKGGQAYVDDTPPEQMKSEREQKLESKNRSNSVEQNMKMWEEMLKGSEYGQKCCVRAKIDMNSVNGCMRDPTIYRCKNEPHPRTGTKYKVYPTYDFACPIVDAIENVTHTLRTMEYHDRDEQFYWFIDALKLRKPYIWEYSRLNMTNTVLSKRKLTWFVESGLVDGWDDPRFPTVRGIVRRGMTVEGLKEFIIAQGSSKAVVFMNWDKIWAFNKKVIDPIAPRYTALEYDNRVLVNVEGAKLEKIEVSVHPKNETLGKKTVTLSPQIYIDYVDAEALKENENATFINWGNLMIKKIHKDASGRITSIDSALNLDNKDFKKTLKLTWLAKESNEDAYPPTFCVYFDNIISKAVLGKDEDFKQYIGHKTREEFKMLGDPELKKLKKGDIIQLQRRGFFKVDNAYAPATSFSSAASPVILFSIPDGHTKDMPSSGLKINTAAKDEKKSSTTLLEAKPTANVNSLEEQIAKQGEIVRELKGKKASKEDIDKEVKKLLSLKADYKSETGNDWKPGPTIKPKSSPESKPSVSPSKGGNVEEILKKISAQGDKVRDLKTAKADKASIDSEVKTLLSLKAQYKELTGSDWKPGTVAPVVQTKVTPVAEQKVTSVIGNKESVENILNKITAQGNKIRDLKAAKAEKSVIDAEVKTLLSLKAQYKELTGSDWKPGTVAPSVEKKESPVAEQKVVGGSVDSILNQITIQGDKVRDLKAAKAEKSAIDTEVKTLLSLKAQYKELTGKDWKPGTVAPVVEKKVTPVAEEKKVSKESVDSILNQIATQGDKVRDLKAAKAEKSVIDTEVKTLLSLKAQYKELTGSDWKPGTVAPSVEKKESPVAEQKVVSGSVDSISNQITTQGNKVRDLKAAKADKSAIDAEVKTLLSLKAQYKELTGKDWKPGTVAPAVEKKISSSCEEVSKKVSSPVKRETPKAPIVQKKEKSPDPPSLTVIEYILSKISQQTDKISQLKANKAEKYHIEFEEKVLVALKADYKSLTGEDWKSTAVPPKNAIRTEPIYIDLTAEDKSSDSDSIEKTPQVERKVVEEKSNMESPQSSGTTEKDLITREINEQANKVRTLKANNAEKEEVDAEIKKLVALKGKYKEVTGTDFPIAGRSQNQSPRKEKKEKKVAMPVKNPVKPESTNANLKKVTRLCLEYSKEDDLAEWYSQVLTKGELIEYYDVSGCYILRPWSFAIWKFIRSWFDAEITKMGVKECYFPIFVSKAALEKEKTHIADFAPEVAWVTKSGDTDLAEHIAVRPTSETVMYPAYAKWIQSYRDLPIRLNQWNNVVRWEFKHPQPFLRTREFLWQEGHTAFASKEEADEEVLQILDLYAQVYTDLLAIPVVKGRKTEKEKFAGGDYTTTVEAFISASGRAIQGATSHHLGQNFSKMFDIIFTQSERNSKEFVYQNSWGITTRTIGVMIMIHADNQGLVLPPHVACLQAVIVPCGISGSFKEEEKAELIEACKKIEQQLCAGGIRCESDCRDNYSAGWKFNHWELKGVPIRIEVGPKDLAANQIVAVRRDTGEKLILAMDNVESKILQLLETIHDSMFAKAQNDLIQHTKLTKTWEEFCKELDQKNILLSPFCGKIPCEDQIKADSARDQDAEPGAPSMGAKSLCIPFDQPAPISPNDKCINPYCTNKPQYYTLFGRSY